MNIEINQENINNVKQVILEIIRTEKITTFDALQKILDNEGLIGKLENSSASFDHPLHRHIVYWLSNNHLLLRAAEQLVSENKILLEKCGEWRYWGRVGHPIAKQIKSYRDIRWYPVTLRINAQVESNVSKLEQEMEERIDTIKNDNKFTNKIKFVISNSRKKQNLHYDYCRKYNIPYVEASAEKHSRVFLDMYHTPYNFTEEGKKAIRCAIRSEILQYPESLQKKWDHSIGSSFVSVYPIKRERLETFCEKLFYLSVAYRDFVEEY